MSSWLGALPLPLVVGLIAVGYSYEELLKEMQEQTVVENSNKIERIDDDVRQFVHLSRQRLDLLPAIYKDQQLAKAAAFDGCVK